MKKRSRWISLLYSTNAALVFSTIEVTIANTGNMWFIEEGSKITLERFERLR